MQLRDIESDDSAYTSQAGDALYGGRQDRQLWAKLLAALDAAQMEDDRLQAIALIERIYAVMDTGHAMRAQDD